VHCAGPLSVTFRTQQANNTRTRLSQLLQCCALQCDFSLSSTGYHSLTHSFSVISENITINHTLLKRRFFGLHFCRKQWSNFNYSDVNVIAPMYRMGEIMPGYSRSPFQYQWKARVRLLAVCVSNNNLPRN